MRHFILGVLGGALLSLIPLWQPRGGAQIYPEWQGEIRAIESIERSPNPALAKLMLPPVSTPEAINVLAASGELLHRQESRGRLLAPSGDGAYFAAYEKAGEKIEFFDIKGNPYWNAHSREYPSLSHRGALVLLMSSDQSQARFKDLHGNDLAGAVSGRFCTVAAFAPGVDMAGIGFLDGSYSIVNHKGAVIAGGRAPADAIVKNIALSANGRFAAVHFGSEKGDGVRIIDISGGERDARLERVHLARTALSIDNGGRTAVLDFNRITILSKRGKALAAVPVPPARLGMSSIVSDGMIYAAAYSSTSGEAQLFIFRADGTVLLSRGFPLEPYLDARLTGSTLLLRGAQGLYCYTILHQ